MGDNMSEIFMNINSKKSIEGESVDLLGATGSIHDDSDPEDSPTMSHNRAEVSLNLPRFPCFSEFNENEVLIIHGQIKQLDKLSKKRYGVLFRSKFVVFKKREENVSKLQIPISCIKNVTMDDKNHEFKLELETGKSYKYTCSNAKMWFDSIINLPKVNVNQIKFKLKEKVLLQDVRQNRIFVAEESNTIAYYESEEYFKHGIAMHRMKVITVNVIKSTTKPILYINAPYRKYALLFKSEELRDLWYDTIQIMVNDEITRPSPDTEAIKNTVYGNVSNQKCGECGSANPEWVSVNLVITLCDNCAGLHRGIANYSRVSSINKDITVWEDGLVAKLFEKLGNNKAHNFWMYLESDEPPDLSQHYLKNKYVRRLYAKPISELLEEYQVQNVNDGLKQAILLCDLEAVMMFYHSGADIDAITIADKIIKKFIQIQLRKNQPNNWRDDFFEQCLVPESSDLSKRVLRVGINDNEVTQMEFVVRKNCVLRFTNIQTKERIFIDIKNVSMVVKSLEEQILTLVIMDTKLGDRDLNTIKIWFEDQSTDLDDLKVIIAQRMCPKFEPRETFQCACWIIMSTANTSWHPYFLVVHQNRLNLIDPLQTENKEINLRKMTQINIDTLPIMDTSCNYQAYNMASLNLVSNVIYHIRNDTKTALDELNKLLFEIRNTHDNCLQNQILTENNVPLAIRKMIDYLHIKATGIEGPFRKAGRKQEAERIYQNLISHADTLVFMDQDPYDVTSAFKLYFRRLSDPLLTQSLYQSWLDAMSVKNHEERMRLVTENLSKLPVVNYQTLREIMFLLKEIADKEETQLTSETISISFNVTFMQTETQGSVAFDKVALELLPFLIDNFYELFQVSETEIKKQEKYREALIKIFDNPPPDPAVLRNFYIEVSLEKFIQKKNMEKSRWLPDQPEDLYQSVCVKEGWKLEDLRAAFFHEEDTKFGVLLFEERQIMDKNLMEMLVYPQQILTDVIHNSDRLNSLTETYVCRFIIKFRPHTPLRLTGIPEPVSIMALYYSVSTNKTSQANVEISVNFLNIFRPEVQELIENIPLKQLTLFRPFQKTNHKHSTSVAFYNSSSVPDTGNLKKIKNLFVKKQLFNFITFQDRSSVEKFLSAYDRCKLYTLTPDRERPNIPIIK